MGEAQQRRHMAHFRHARLVTVAQAGHFLFNEQPKASMEIVRSFLGEPD
jgi:pimeloyl-ACP methyl ester carboxylesterase